MNKKTVAFHLIEKGYSNEDIAEAMGITSKHARSLRRDYNEVAGAARKPNVRTKPKLGTKNRVIYDYLLVHPTAKMREVAEATGTDPGNVATVKGRYIARTRA